MTETQPKKKWWQSSSHEGLSLTLKGAIVGVVPLITLVLNQTGIDIAEGEIVSFVEAVWGMVAAALIAFGLGRKIAYKFKK